MAPYNAQGHIWIVSVTSWILLLACGSVHAKGGGGGGGGGGSGFSSGGGYYHSSPGTSNYYHSSCTNCDGGADDDDDNSGLTTGGWILVACLASAGCLLYGICLKEATYQLWSQKITAAETEVTSDATLRGHHGGYGNYGNTTTRNDPCFTVEQHEFAFRFRAHYTDSTGGLENMLHESKGDLEFSKPPQGAATASSEYDDNPSRDCCLVISGCGTDRDGGFTITQGMLSPVSGKCYWLEVSDIDWRQVLVIGTFHHSNTTRQGGYTFQGRWQSQNGEGGFFTNFDLTPLPGNATRTREAAIPAIAMPSAAAVPVEDGSDWESAVPVEAKPVDTVIGEGTRLL